VAAVFAAANLLFCVSAEAESRQPPDLQLFEAVRRNDLAAVQTAIAAGADPGHVDEWGLTAADVALDKGYFPIARFLMDRKGTAVAAAPVPAPAPPPPPVAAVAPPPPPPPPEPPAPVSVPPEPPAPIADAPAPEPEPKAAEGKEGTFLDRLQADLRRLMAMDTAAKGPPPADLQLPDSPEAAVPVPEPEPAGAAEMPPAADPAWAPKEVKVPSAPVEEPPPVPPAPLAEVAALPPAPEAKVAPPPMAPEPVMEPPPAAAPDQTWVPKEVILPPPADPLTASVPVEAPPMPEPPPPPKAAEGDFLSRLTAELRRVMGTGERQGQEAPTPETQIAALPPAPMPEEPAKAAPPSETVPDAPMPEAEAPPPSPPQAEDWAPKVAVEGKPLEEKAMPPAVEAPAPAREEQGLLGRFFASVKESLSGEKSRRTATVPPPDARPSSIGPAPTAESKAVVAAADPTVAAVPESRPAKAGDEGGIPASLRRLGIPDIGKYLSDEPYRPGEMAAKGETDAGGTLPPLSQVTRDPFSPGSPVPGGSMGEGGRFDPRYDKGESRDGGLADALAPLGAAGGEAPPKEGGGGIFDRLTDFLKPPDRLPDRKAPPPPSGLFEEAPAPKDKDKAPPQVAMRPPKEAEVHNLPKASGVALTVPLQLVEGMTPGKSPPPIQGPVSTAAYGQTCVGKERSTIVFCVEPVAWPDGVRDAFVVDTVLYQGFQAIVRYDGEKASTIQTLFRSESFDAVVDHFTKLYGPPTDAWMRRIAPLGSPGQDNPTVAWRSGNVVNGQVAHLEVRAYDDSRGGFPDMRHGTVLLRDAEARPIFPRLSSLDLMVMKPRAVTPKSAPATPREPGE
jgi:hypothetical protein